MIVDVKHYLYSIKQHSSDNSCGFLASQIELLTNTSAASILKMCVYSWIFYLYIVCVCVHITAL